MNRQRILLLIKVGTSAVLIGYILRTTDLSALRRALLGANYTIVALSFLLHWVGYLLSAARWQVLLRAREAPVPIRRLVSSHLVATFFNNFLPTTVGGDAVRAYDAARYTDLSLPRAAGVVTLDRLLGVFALFLFSTLAFFIGFEMFSQNLAVMVTLGLLAGVFLVMLAFATDRVTRLMEGLFDLPFIRQYSVTARIHSFYEMLHTYKDHRSALVKALLVALLLQINVILHYYLISVSLYQKVSLLYFVLFIPVLLILLQIAPSFNGIGYREAGFVFFLSPLGVDAASAVSLSLLDFGMKIVLSVIGGLIFALRRERVALEPLDITP